MCQNWVLFYAFGISCQKSVCLTYSCAHCSNNDMRNMITSQAVMLKSHKTHTRTHTQACTEQNKRLRNTRRTVCTDIRYRYCMHTHTDTQPNNGFFCQRHVTSVLGACLCFTVLSFYCSISVGCYTVDLQKKEGNLDKKSKKVQKK